MLSRQEAHDWATRLHDYHKGELETLDVIHDYLTGRQGLPVVPKAVPNEVRRCAQMSRINIIKTVIDVMTQALYIDGYRENPAVSEADAPAWAIWQQNRMDAHQTGVHRAALAYGTSYVIVLPGDPAPVIRGVAPRSLTAMYDENSHDWPYYALEVVASPWDETEYRLYDEDAVFTFREENGEISRNPARVETHELGVCPIIRFRNTDTLNEPPGQPHHRSFAYTPGDTGGEVQPLMSLQDQVDFTTFDLLVAQHFQSFRQRYILGWVAKSEAQLAKTNASQLWAFPNAETRVGEFGQVDLKGYLDSRESTITQVGVLSQTPGHELLGKMVNLSAEALVAAEVGQRRRVLERQNLFGESWEQTFWLASRADGLEPAPGAQVRWRDTEARSLSQTIDALGKLAQMLDVPPEMLWERVPGVSQQDVTRWLAERGASQLLAAAAAAPPETPPAEEPAPVGGG